MYEEIVLFAFIAGTCLSCDRHTSGDHCEYCYPGYVGDAIMGTCGNFNFIVAYWLNTA